MKTPELIKKISKETTLTQSQVKEVLDSLTEIVNKEVYRGVNIEMRGLVSFQTVTSKARKARNPRTGETIDVPKRYKLKTKPSIVLAKKVSQKPCY